MSQWVVVILCYFQVPVKSYDVHKEMFEAPWIPTDAIPLHLARHSQSREVGTGSAFISAPPRPTRWFDNFLFGNWGWWYLVISGDGAIMFTKRGQVTKFPRSHHLWTALEGYGGIWRDDGCADRCSCRYIMLPLYTFVYGIWLIWPYMTYMTYMTYMCAGLKWFESRLHPINSSGARLGSCKKSWNGI